MHRFASSTTSITTLLPAVDISKRGDIDSRDARDDDMHNQLVQRLLGTLFSILSESTIHETVNQTSSDKFSVRGDCNVSSEIQESKGSNSSSPPIKRKTALDYNFFAAVKFSRSILGGDSNVNVSVENKVMFFALFKQATLGDFPDSEAHEPADVKLRMKYIPFFLILCFYCPYEHICINIFIL